MHQIHIACARPGVDGRRPVWLGRDLAAIDLAISISYPSAAAAVGPRRQLRLFMTHWSIFTDAKNRPLFLCHHPFLHLSYLISFVRVYRRLLGASSMFGDVPPAALNG